MLNQALLISTWLLAIALLLCCYRLWRGPTACDRVLALDTLYITAIGLLVVQNIHYGRQWYFEVALLIAALGFFATVVLAKYLMRGTLPAGIDSEAYLSDGGANNAGAAD